MKRVEVVPHDPKWRDAFNAEARSIAAAVGENLAAIHHIGSTSIPGIYAKAVIDILVEVKNISELDRQNLAMNSLGYEALGEFGISGRRYYRRDSPQGFRTHQVHAFELMSPEVERHLSFRDYMIAHPDDALKYSDLKRNLAEKYPDNMDGYIDGKDGFIKEIDRLAARWRTPGPVNLPD